MKCKEIWYVNFDPSLGNEIKKIRPAVIIDDDYLASKSMRLIIPLTTWKSKFDLLPWLIKIQPNTTNGLANISGFNIQQARYSSTNRFQNKIGIIDDVTLITVQKGLIKFINPNLHKLI